MNTLENNDAVYPVKGFFKSKGLKIINQNRLKMLIKDIWYIILDFEWNEGIIL